MPRRMTRIVRWAPSARRTTGMIPGRWSEMSLAASDASINTGSGVTSTVAKLVCRLPWALNGLTRASRCVPRSHAR